MPIDVLVYTKQQNRPSAFSIAINFEHFFAVAALMLSYDWSWDELQLAESNSINLQGVHPTQLN